MMALKRASCWTWMATAAVLLLHSCRRPCHSSSSFLVEGFPRPLPVGNRRTRRQIVAGRSSINHQAAYPQKLPHKKEQHYFRSYHYQSHLVLLSSSRRNDVACHEQQPQTKDTSDTTSTTTTTQKQKPTTANSNKHQQQQQQKKKKKKKFQHAMAILAMPYTSLDRIANEVILNTVLPRTNKLSVVLRCESPQPPSLPRLRRYVGEVYSQLWDCVMYETTSNNNNNKNGADRTSEDDDEEEDVLPPVFCLPDICVYPANLPNAAPESWIDIQPDLQAVCSHDSLTGWISEGGAGTGLSYQASEGVGGLAAHVRALNAERAQRKLPPVQALPVPDQQWPIPVTNKNVIPNETVIFVDDDPEDQCQSPLWQAFQEQTASAAATANNNKKNNNKNDDDDACLIPSFLGGANIPNKALFESVCCGGTFDGMHFGHRKLLTLAVSSVNPLTGRLLIGVTVDRMLTKKQYAAYMPSYQERVQGVRNFVHRLAPGMMNRVQIVPIEDAFGPPGHATTAASQQFDALVLSHETLETGHELNRHRVFTLKLPPLTLLCTRRTEAHGMSSTTLRKLRAEHVGQASLTKQQHQQQQSKPRQEEDTQE